MKVVVDPHSLEALTALFEGFPDPCLVIACNHSPSRDLLRGPDGRAVHVRIDHPPWEAIPLAQAARLISAGGFVRLECREALCLLQEGITEGPDLKIIIEGQKIHVQPIQPDARVNDP